MVQKPTIIITSLGRTGTKFFATLFDSIISNSTSLHEPDVLGIEPSRGPSDVIRQIREAGWRNMLWGKIRGKWSVIELSDSRVRGELELSAAIHRLTEQRGQFIHTRPGSIYIEANPGFYGLIDILPHVHARHRAVYIIRDGRSWVRSWMNWGHLYAKGPIRRAIVHTWPTATEINTDPYRHQWAKMSRFERVCWAWATLNQYALTTIKENPNARLFYFEEIFKAEDRYKHLRQLIQFSTAIPGQEPMELASLDGWLEQQIHPSKNNFPSWPDWSLAHKQQFEKICGPLMRQMGYF